MNKNLFNYSALDQPQGILTPQKCIEVKYERNKTFCSEEVLAKSEKTEFPFFFNTFSHQPLFQQLIVFSLTRVQT